MPVAFPAFPFAAVRTFVFRRCQAGPATPPASAAEAERRARKQLKKQRREERLRSFYSWCAGCKAFGSAF